MSARVVVVGSGYAGLAAAWAASRVGAKVTMLLGSAGASSLGSGAVDDVYWDARVRAAEIAPSALSAPELGEDVRALFDALGGHRIAAAGTPLALLATTAGVLRVACGHDEALLDVRGVAGRTVLLPRVDRAGWDADALARCFEASPDKPEGTRFVACDAPILRFADEERACDADLAARHDDDARLEWLARGLAGVVGDRRGRIAFLLGPWLGLSSARARALSDKVGEPVGEVLSSTAGVAGLRFDAARDALLDKLGARTVVARATRVSPSEQRFAITTTGDPARVDGDAIVVATGGLAAGGLTFSPGDARAGAEGATRVGAAFVLSVEVPGARVTDGCDTGAPSTTHGLVLDDALWPRGAGSSVLERPGLLVGSAGRIGRGIFAAGDVVANRHRTVLQAIAAGIAAGDAAAREALETSNRPVLPLDPP